MDISQIGVNFLKQSKIDEAFHSFADGFFVKNDVRCGCYLAQMFYDRKIEPKDDIHDYMAYILWTITAEAGKDSSMHRLGVDYLKSRNIEIKRKGIEYLEKAFASGHATSSIVLGMGYYSIGEYDKAVEYFQKTDKNLFKEAEYIAFGKSLFFAEKHDEKKAVEILVYCLEKFNSKNSAEMLYKYYSGELFDTDIKDENAANKYQKMLANMGDKHSCLMYGKRLFQSQRYDEAIEYLLKAGNEIDCNGYIQIGRIYSSEYKDFQKAEEYYRFAYNLSPKEERTNYLLGVTLFSEEKYKESRPFLEYAYKMDNDDECLCDCLFHIYSGREETKNKAVEIAEKITSRNLTVQSIDEVYYLLGEAHYYGKYGKLQNIDIGIHYLNYACRENSVKAKLKLAEFYFGNNKTGLSDENIEKWLYDAYYSGSGVAAYYLGLYYCKFYKMNEAREWLAKAFESYHIRNAALKMAELYELGCFTGRKDKKNAALWRDKANNA